MRVLCGLILIIVGIIMGPLPGPGFIFWIPGLFIIFGRKKTLKYAAKIIRFAYKYTGLNIRFWRRKRKKRQF